MDYKNRIKELRLDRKVLAARLKMSYPSLTARLNGFQRFASWEERLLIEILSECETVKREIEARLDAKQEVYRG